MNKPKVLDILRLIAAKAEQLAKEVEQDKLWGGDLSAGLLEIRLQAERAERASRQ